MICKSINLMQHIKKLKDIQKWHRGLEVRKKYVKLILLFADDITP